MREEWIHDEIGHQDFILATKWVLLTIGYPCSIDRASGKMEECSQLGVPIFNLPHKSPF